MAEQPDNKSIIPPEWTQPPKDVSIPPVDPLDPPVTGKCQLPQEGCVVDEEGNEATPPPPPPV